MEFKAPIPDMQFVLNELANLDQIISLPGFEEVSPDLVEAVLQENARFVENEIAPLNVKGDTNPVSVSDGVVTTAPGFKEAFKEFANAGWQGLNHGTEVGGQGLPKVVATPVNENLNAANLSFALCPLLTDGVIEAITQVGTQEQKDTFLPPMVEGRWSGTMNLTEPQAGSDLSLVTSRAVAQGDGTYRITGQKIFITYGEHDMTENIIHLVLARLPGAPDGVKGISLFVVPKFLVNADGTTGKRNDVWCASLEHKLGIHASPTAVLLYGSGKGEVGEGGAVGYLVGQENEGLKYMFIMMNAARYAVGVQGIAVSEAALQRAQSYAHERVQSRAITGSDGPVAIANHPDVQRMLMTMRALTEGSRALAYVAAAQCDVSRHHESESERKTSNAVYEYLVPIVKGFSTEMSLEVTSLAIQVHGGMGFIEETGVAQFYRDARILPIYEGTTAIQANDFLGRKLYRDAGAVANALAGNMKSTLDELQQAASNQTDNTAGLQLIAQQFDAAIQAYEQSSAFMLNNATSNLPAAFLGSVPYLMLAGTVLAGWQMARAALVCEDKIRNGSTDNFYKTKFATCVAYATFIMPRAAMHAASIVIGDKAAPYIESACVAE